MGRRALSCHTRLLQRYRPLDHSRPPCAVADFGEVVHRFRFLKPPKILWVVVPVLNGGSHPCGARVIHAGEL
jgi:hypothetical protein